MGRHGFRITLTCSGCRNTFDVPPSEYKRKYCSWACFNGNLAPRNTECLWCKAPLDPERISNRSKRAPSYCNTACANKKRWSDLRKAPADDVKLDTSKSRRTATRSAARRSNKTPAELGADAFRKGYSLDNNPYDRDLEELKHQEWKDGFRSYRKEILSPNR